MQEHQPKLIELIKAEEKERGLQILSDNVGVSYNVLRDLAKGKNKKYRKQSMDVLYCYFDLEHDQFYIDNIKKWNPPTYSVMGNIIRLRRVAQGMSVEDLAKRIKGEKRQIFRIEAGDSLSSFRSRYISEILEALEFTEDEKITLRRFITLQNDIIKIMRKYDTDGKLKEFFDLQ